AVGLPVVAGQDRQPSLGLGERAVDRRGPPERHEQVAVAPAEERDVVGVGMTDRVKGEGAVAGLRERGLLDPAALLARGNEARRERPPGEWELHGELLRTPDVGRLSGRDPVRADVAEAVGPRGQIDRAIAGLNGDGWKPVEVVLFAGAF